VSVRTRPETAANVPPMRGSRRLWITFAFLIGMAVVAIPIGVARSRSAAARPSASAAPSHAGWAPYSPTDASFQVLGPAGAQTSVLSTGIGPAHRATFAGGSYSVTWLDAPVQGTDEEALQAGKESLLRPLVGRVADEEVDLVDAGHPGFGLLVTINGTSYDVRLFAANGRLFQVVGSAPSGSTEMSSAIDFVDSFELR
jgi:hypothetical protein